MGWKGMAIGGWVGSLFGGPLGALLGAVLGHKIEKEFVGEKPKSGRRATFVPPQRRAMVFCASAAAMLAKMAKADGHVSRSEIAAVERAFEQLGFDAETRAYAINVFRRAKDDAHTIYEYAAEFAGAVDSIDVREIFYGILWDLACADGVLAPDEREILRRIPQYLRIRADWFLFYSQQRVGGGSGGYAEPPRDELADAYRELGVSPDASDDAVKTAYRELAKKNHPDALRAQGLPEELVGKANEKMGRINAAWKVIREKRGI